MSRRSTPARPMTSSVRPGPFADLGHVLEVLDDVAVVPREHLVAMGKQLRGASWKTARPVDGFDGEVVAAGLVEDDHVERCRRGALLAVAVDVETLGVWTAVEELVDGTGVPVVREDDVG